VKDKIIENNMLLMQVIRMEYDLVVVGAGPAGSIAAKTAAEKGLDVLLVEKRQEIGTPVRCGELVSSRAIAKFTEINKKWVAAEVKWAKIYLPDGKEIIQSGEDEKEVQLVLERKIFDRHLAELAAKAGADIMVKTAAIGLKRRKDGLVDIILRKIGEDFSVKSKIIIGADGIESRVGKWAGIDTSLELDEIGSAVQYLMIDVDFDSDYAYFWFSKDIAPGGYAWLFPKGERKANIGLGVIPALTNKSAKEYLDDFVKKNFEGGKILEVVAGAVPLKGPIETAVADNVMLAGDAARHADPFTGGGIANAMKAGFFAACVAAEAIEKKDYSREFLKKYDEFWKNDFGKMLRENRIRLEELISVLYNL